MKSDNVLVIALVGMAAYLLWKASGSVPRNAPVSVDSWERARNSASISADPANYGNDTADYGNDYFRVPTGTGAAVGAGTLVL